MPRVTCQRLSFELAEPWRVHNEPSTHESLGIYVGVDALSMHIREFPGIECPRAEDELRTLLEQQNWASGPVDIDAWSDGEFFGVAGTFSQRGAPELVREWFVTDGRRLANCAAIGSEQALEAYRVLCDELARSIRFLED